MESGPRSDLSRGSQQHIQNRRASYTRCDGAPNCLNDLYGIAPDSHDYPCSATTMESDALLIDFVKLEPRTDMPGQEALKSLLVATTSSDGKVSPPQTLAPYDRGLLALPSAWDAPPMVVGHLDAEGARIVKEFE